MKEHIQDILVGGRPMTKLELANKEIERLNKVLEYIELYWSNREEYEKNELLRQIIDKNTSIEWLDRAIDVEKNFADRRKFF